MGGVASNTHFKIEFLASVIPMPMQMGKAHAAPQKAGVETVLITANVLHALTPEVGSYVEPPLARPVQSRGAWALRTKVWTGTRT